MKTTINDNILSVGAASVSAIKNYDISYLNVDINNLLKAMFNKHVDIAAFVSIIIYSPLTNWPFKYKDQHPCTAPTINLFKIPVIANSMITFEVVASGSNLKYVWSRNGSIVIGENKSKLVLPDISSNHGTYHVSAVNNCGSANSITRTI